MKSYDVIAHLYDHAIAEPGCCQSPDHSTCTVIFADTSEWDWDGLTCWECDATIIPADCCPTCDRSIRDEHDRYRFGPTEDKTVIPAVCPTNLAVDIRVRIRIDGVATIANMSGVATYHQVVPAKSADDALDMISEAFAGHVATFDVAGIEGER